LFRSEVFLDLEVTVGVSFGIAVEMLFLFSKPLFMSLLVNEGFFEGQISPVSLSVAGLPPV
jgi:hypothetical protein